MRTNVRHLEDKGFYISCFNALTGFLPATSEIDSLNVIVAQHMFRGALCDAFAKVNRQHAINKNDYALHMMVYQQNSAPLIMEA